MASDQTPPMGSMFSLGWLMAQLFGPLQSRPKVDPAGHLPSLYELDAAEFMDVALAELGKLLASLPGLSEADVETACANIKAEWNPDNPDDFKAAVKKLHLTILQQLVGDHQQLSAYQLGRALSDTCWLPSETTNDTGGQFFLREFDRRQLALLQTWLTEAGDAIPQNSGATVSQSLQNWQNWADVNAAVIKGRWTTVTTSGSVTEALRNQALAWYALLSGQKDMSGPISVDAWVRAGQSLAQSTGSLVTTILRRFWPVVVIIAAATGGLLYLAIANSAGTAKVWTSLVTVAAALGVSGVSLRSAALKAAGGIKQDIFDAADLDARAWSITWLPTLPLGPVKRHRLAGRGVAAPQVKAGLEQYASPANESLATGTSTA